MTLYPVGAKVWRIGGLGYVWPSVVVAGEFGTNWVGQHVLKWYIVRDTDGTTMMADPSDIRPRT